MPRNGRGLPGECATSSSKTRRNKPRLGAWKTEMSRWLWAQLQPRYLLSFLTDFFQNWFGKTHPCKNPSCSLILWVDYSGFLYDLNGSNQRGCEGWLGMACMFFYLLTVLPRIHGLPCVCLGFLTWKMKIKIRTKMMFARSGALFLAGHFSGYN